MAVTTERPVSAPPYSPPSQPVGSLDLTVKQAAEALDCHPKTVRRYIEQGKLHWTTVQGKFGPEYRVSRASVEQLSRPTLSPGQANIDKEGVKGIAENTEAIRQLTVVVEGLGQRLLPAAQGEEQAHVQALRELSEAVRGGMDQQQRIQHLEERIQQLEQPRPWWKIWERRKGRADNAQA